MNLTELNRRWLDQRFSRAKDGSYFSHEPIYGLKGKEHTEGDPAICYSRILQVIRLLDRMAPFHSLLDVGGAEGYLARLAQKVFGARVVNFDLSKEANHRAREIFDLEGVAGVAHELPFKTGAFDVVTCIEAIEHLEGPLQSILELDRVSSRHLIVSSVNFVRGEQDRKERLATRRFGFHFDRNCFTTKDFEVLLGATNLTQFGQYRETGTPFGDSDSLWEARRLVGHTIAPPDKESVEGVVIVKSKAGSLAEKGNLPEERFWDAISTETVQPNRVLFHPPDGLRNSVLQTLCCPDCRIQSGAEKEFTVIVDESSQRLVCEANLHCYSIEEGVPLLYPNGGLTPRALETVLDSGRYSPDDLRYLRDLEHRFSSVFSGFIDCPPPDSTVEGELQVRGWVVDLRAGSQLTVEAILDGKPAGSAQNDLPRQDVVDYFRTLQIRVPTESGFIISLDSELLSSGTHVLRVLVRNSSGGVFEIGQTGFQYSI